MLDALVPVLPGSTRLHVRDDGSAVLYDAERGVAVELASDQAAIAAGIDGRRSVQELVAACFAARASFSFEALSDLLARLRQTGLLGNEPSALDQAGVARPRPASPLQRVFTGRLARIVGPAASTLAAAVMLLLAAWAVFGLLSKSLVDGPLDPLLPGRSPLAGLVGAVLGAAFALVARSAARACVSLAWGARPAAVELRRYLLLVVPVVEDGPEQMLPRMRRIAVHLSALAAPWVASYAAAATAFSGRGPAWASVALGAAVVGFFDAIPFAPTSLGKALAAFAGRVNLLDHLRAYVTRRFVSRVVSRGSFDGEGGIVLSSLLSILWVSAMIRAVGKGAAPELARLVAAAMTAQGVERAAGWAVAGLVLLSVTAALVEVAAVLVFFVRSAAPGLFVAKGATGIPQQAPPADALEALRQVPLLSGLSTQALEGVAREALFATYKDKQLIMRQGDPADRFMTIVSGQVEVLREGPSGLRRTLATLGQGDCFGETALLDDSRRTASVQARGPVRVLSISRASFERLRRELANVDLTAFLRATAALHRSALAHALPPERIAEIVPRMKIRACAPGEAVCRIGEPGDNFYVIDSGRVEVLDADGASIATLGPGESFGETALLVETPRTATVRALEPASLLALDRVGLYAVLSRNAALSEALSATVASRAALRKAG
jgi:CRP-like cAMP-binding protein